MAQTLPGQADAEHARCGQCGKVVPVIAGRLGHHLTADIDAQRCPGTGMNDPSHVGPRR